jgi:hypothetical protein
VNAYRRFFLFASLPMALAACVVAPAALKDRGALERLQVSTPVDKVYRLVVEGARNCYLRQQVVGDFFPDQQLGRISVSGKTTLSHTPLLLVEMRPSVDGTQIEVYYLRGGLFLLDGVRQWSSGNAAFCSGPLG